MTDSSAHDASTLASTVFAGLKPSTAQPERARHLAPKAPSRIARSLHSTVPILLAGTMAVSMNLTGPVEPASAKRPAKPKQSMSDLGQALRDAAAQPAAKAETFATTIATAAAPSTYRVVAGDTVSGIAGRYGLATASVLALNGLSWSSLIFPGQVLKLTNAKAPSTPAPSTPAPSVTKYTIVSGDTISGIASRFGLSTQAVLSANGLSWSSIIYPGQKITIPGVESSSSVTPAPKAPAPAPPTSGTYRIVSGDTITSIAARFGVSVQALLNANGLSYSSIIYAGSSLVIPGVATPAGSTGITPLNAEMAGNAAIIIQVGRELGVPEYGIVIALAAAMQESSLRNIDWGDRDSIGLFQQRPSAGWGTVADILNPHHAARLFYGGPSNPNKGNTRGLLDIKGWQSMTVTQAAQAVQISAYPDAYAKWETSARAWLAQLG